VRSVGVKTYQAEGFYLEVSTNGNPYFGTMRATDETESGPYEAEVNLQKAGSRERYARKATELYGMETSSLERALNELCTRRSEQVAAAESQDAEDERQAPERLSEAADALVSPPGVLSRYVEDVARIRGVVGDRETLKLQTLVALGAQLVPLPSGSPAGANLILTAEAGRGKNYILDAVTSALPEEFFFTFESASAKSLYYRAESDPECLKHRLLYPNEAEGMDLLVALARPLLSGGKACHLTVNRTEAGRNAAQQLNIEGPASITIPTVRNKLDTQLQTRMLVAELQDYSGRVAKHSRMVSRLLLPDQAGEDHGSKVEAWRAALRSLTALRRVVFPLDREEFCFDSDTVSHGARLWAGLLGLMLANGWLEQRNREVMELANGEQVIVATPEDYTVAYNVFEATCERSVINLSDRHRAILDAVYELSSESTFDGFSLRKIAEKAGVHHSTVAEHKSFLTKSAKLLKETEGGLDLVSNAEPSWWGKDDLLLGFPRPAQVRRWWEEGELSSPESARQTRQPSEEDRETHAYAENAVGDPTRQPPNTARQTPGQSDGEGVSGTKSTVSGTAPDTEKSVGKAKSGGQERVSGVSGGFERKKCIHEVPGGCWLCNKYRPEEWGEA